MSFVPRVFLPSLSSEIKEIALGEPLAHYLTKVLRLKAGDHFWGIEPGGHEYDLVLERVDVGRPLALVLDRQVKPKEPDLSITLAQGLPKGSKMDLILRQCTEVGVDRFIPLLTQHSVSRPETSRHEHKGARWSKILVEACRQSGRNSIPRLDPLVEWNAGLSLFQEFDLVVMPYEKDAPGLRTILESVPIPKKILILIGPEGGWALDEVKEAGQNGALTVHLPTPILRTETAGMATASMIRFFFGFTGYKAGGGS